MGTDVRRQTHMPCIHADNGKCWLRRCWLRGCVTAKAKRLTDGTGKLAGDRLCQGPGGGFCEYIHACTGLCKKIMLRERMPI